MKKLFTLLFITYISISHIIASESITPANKIQTNLRYLLGKNEYHKKLQSYPEVLQFYLERDFRAAWSHGIKPKAEAFILNNFLADSSKDGLNPDNYHFRNIDSSLAWIEELNHLPQKAKANDIAKLDILLTDAFITYSKHLAFGKIKPEEIGAFYTGIQSELNPVEYLSEALANNDITNYILDLIPNNLAYRLLREKLGDYLSIVKNGGWPTIPTTKKLEHGYTGDIVLILRERLIIEGYLRAKPFSNGNTIDEEVVNAVKRFQRSHGLKDDGIIGKGTLKELNISARKRVEQIKINLERIKWLPDNLGSRHIIVNLADFTLNIVDNKKLIQQHRVVIGNLYRKTPLFSANITYLVLNPYWNITENIAKWEILPMVKKYPDYLKRKKIKTFKYPYSHEVTDINWEKISADKFKYYFRQEPGDHNSLGRYKFMFPNKYNVYIHDTTQKKLFDKTVRAFSHGCIRLENPEKLARYLLKRDPKWNNVRIKKAIDTLTEHTIPLQRSIPLYLFYRTAWVDNLGQLQLRNDIYDRDNKLSDALKL